MKEGVKEFNSIQDTLESPLASELLSIDGVSSVFYGPDFITVSKTEKYKWEQIKPNIFSAIMNQYNLRGEELIEAPESRNIKESNAADMPHDSTLEIVNAIVKLIDSRIRPVVQQDGGDIEYRGFLKGYVKLRMQGACKSCSSSVITLRNGIESMLMHYIPEVKGVEQVTDEAESISESEFKRVEEGKYPRDDDHDDAEHEKSDEDLLSVIKTKKPVK
jgi:Fe-S cluster biogenesis protein NfuA